MRTRSWNEIAREYSDRIVRVYNSKDNEEQAEYKKFLFEQLMSPMGSGKYKRWWRNPLIQHRIAKRLHRKLKMF